MLGFGLGMDDETDSTYTSELGFFFFLRMAVATSSSCGGLAAPVIELSESLPTFGFVCSLPEGSLLLSAAAGEAGRRAGGADLLGKVHLGLRVVWLSRHVERASVDYVGNANVGVGSVSCAGMGEGTCVGGVWKGGDGAR